MISSDLCVILTVSIILLTAANVGLNKVRLLYALDKIFRKIFFLIDLPQNGCNRFKEISRK
jgi:hypothetical protein